MNCVPAFTAVCSSLEVWNTWANAAFAWYVCGGPEFVKWLASVRDVRLVARRKKADVYMAAFCFKKALTKLLLAYCLLVKNIFFPLSHTKFLFSSTFGQFINVDMNVTMLHLKHLSAFLTFKWHGTGKSDFQIKKLFVQMLLTLVMDIWLVFDANHLLALCVPILDMS